LALGEAFAESPAQNAANQIDFGPEF